MNTFVELQKIAWRIVFREHQLFNKNLRNRRYAQLSHISHIIAVAIILCKYSEV